MAQLRIMPFFCIALLGGLGVWLISDRRGEATEMAPLCQGAQAGQSFDKALIYIQSAQAYLTGRVDGPDPAQCPDSTIGRFLQAKDSPAELDSFYDQRLEQREGLPSVEARYLWDVETLLQINLECNANWDCARDRITTLISSGLNPSQSLIFCGFDDSPSPNATEVKGQTDFRSPQSLPFICDELLGGSGISNGWASAYADYFDGR